MPITTPPSIDTRAHRRRTRVGMRTLVTHVAPVAAILGGLFALGGAANAVQGPVGLGTAASFAILAGSGITNTGPTTVTGDAGTYPTPSESGFGPGADSVTFIPPGVNHAGDAVTQGAKSDLTTAYNDAAGRGPATSKPVELGGTTLLAGVYSSPTFGLTGTLTLDAQGDPNAEFIFQTSSTLITASNSRVALINQADPCHVVWKVGSSATFGTGTQFVGDVLAQASIQAQTSATFQGRLLAQTGAVTLDTNTITNANCAAVTPATTSTSAGPTSTTAGGGTTTTTAASTNGGATTTSTTVLASGATPGGTSGGTGPVVGGLGGAGGTGAGGTGAGGTGQGGAGAGAGGGAGTAGLGTSAAGGGLTGSGTTANGTATRTGTGLAFTGLRATAMAMAGLVAILLGTLLLLAARRPTGNHFIQ